ncbi:MAG: hypothetical protein HPM95_16170 [Alphaproteobacteria bacterium]|nr:hypothetical protein [Alphaproteobacteria bacterium]
MVRSFDPQSAEAGIFMSVFEGKNIRDAFAQILIKPANAGETRDFSAHCCRKVTKSPFPPAATAVGGRIV